MGVNQRSQVVMTADEIRTFIERSRTAAVATIGAGGMPHVMGMWYGLVDGHLWFETKAKSQKAQNLRRDSRMTCMICDGDTYDTLRGVSIEGRGVLIDDPDPMWAVGVSIWDRYSGPYSEEVRPLVEFMLHKRVVIRLDEERVRSWDHSKLGLPPMPLGGSTLPYLRR